MSEHAPKTGHNDGGPKDFDPIPLPASLRHLYAHSTDYAGWAPPSANTLEVALANFRQYSQSESPAHWILRNFTLTYAHLESLDPSTLHGLPLSVIVADADTDHSVAQLNRLVDDPQFRGIHLAAIEMRAASMEEIRRTLDHVPQGATPLFEVPLDPHIISEVAIESKPFGIKARTEGTQNTSAEALAAFLSWQGQKKVTSGIHFPFTGINPISGRHDYGNVNVSLAAVAAYTGAEAQHVMEILLNEDPAAFVFGDQEIRVGESDVLTLKHIIAARNESLQSIGTCNALRILQELNGVYTER